MASKKEQKKYPGYSYVKTVAGISEFTLNRNGLRVLVKEDRTMPVIASMVTYHVGSRNEAIGYTGATHLLEHLMFKGSKHFNKKNEGQIFTVLERKGARMNATTFLDRTNYYAVVPREHIDLALAAEADRMRNAFIRESDRKSEMPVVRNEFEIGENSPLEALDKNIWATAYQAHPYHHSTIGWRSDIENVSIERLRAFYDTFYWPNNATVTIVGDIDTTEALKKVRTYYGVYSRSPHTIPEVYTEEPHQQGPRHATVCRASGFDIVGIAHKTPAGHSEDMPALLTLFRILSDGKSSRLYDKLVNTGLARHIEPIDIPFRDPGLFVVYAYAAPNVDHERIKDAVLEEYENVCKNGVGKDELARAKAQIASETAFAEDGPYKVVEHLNEAIALGDWTYFLTLKNRISGLTPADIQRVAKRYLHDSQMTTGYFKTKK